MVKILFFQDGNGRGRTRDGEGRKRNKPKSVGHKMNENNFDFLKIPPSRRTSPSLPRPIPPPSTIDNGLFLNIDSGSHSYLVPHGVW